MGSGWSRVGQAAGSLLVLMLLLLCPAPAFAHKLYVFAAEWKARRFTVAPISRATFRLNRAT